MKRITIFIMAFSLLGCGAQQVKTGSSKDIWWMAMGYSGKCQKSVGKFDWLNPDDVIKEYKCELKSNENGVVHVSCNDGPLKGNNYAFTKSEELCLEVAKSLAQTKGN